MFKSLKFWRREELQIPQAEIDEEARRLIAEYGAGAVTRAGSVVQRTQSAKGNNDETERAKRVLQAVRKMAGYSGVTS